MIEGSSPLFTNCVIAGNTAPGREGHGGAVYSLGSSPVFTNCTIAGNSGGGLVIEGESALTLTNSIVRENGGESLQVEDSTVVATFSSIEGEAEIWPGEGNINADPLFVSIDAEFDLRLQPESPCIDAGTLSGAPETDLEGTPRPQGAGVDMGAYEFLPPGGLQLPGDCDQNGSISLTDGICVLGFLFRSQPDVLPCGDGAADDPGNLALLDMDGDGSLALTDGVRIFLYLFAGGAPPPLCPDAECGECVGVTGCPDSSGACGA